jgi:DNA-binding CsgD family transcriptional regulator
MAQSLDKNFTHHRIVFGLKGLMSLINSGEEFPAGTCFVWEEFQISGGNRSWQSLANRLLNSLLSTFRHKRFILLINSPFSDFIDSHSKKLLHAEIELIGIDKNTNQTITKPMITQYNSRRKKFYYKYLRIKTKNGVSPVKKWRIRKPSQELINIYEEMKHKFTTDLNKSIEKQLDRLDADDNAPDNKKQLSVKQQEVYDLMLKYNDVLKVAKELGISVRTTYFHLLKIKNKGYDYGEQEEKAVN